MLLKIVLLCRLLIFWFCFINKMNVLHKIQTENKYLFIKICKTKCKFYRYGMTLEETGLVRCGKYSKESRQT